MEVIALLYFAIIPGCVLGFLLGFFWLFRKFEIGGRIVTSIVTGLALGYFSPCLITIPARLHQRNQEYKRDKQAQAELIYFQAAVQGEYDEVKLREHYKSHPFPDTFRYKSRELIDRSKMKISPKAIQLLIEICDKNPEVKGILAVQTETSTELKLIIAGSPDIQAVLPMAIDSNTPSEVLIVLAKHKSIVVSREVNRNSNAPLIAKYTYYIRNVRDKDENAHKENIIEPRDDDNNEVIRFWNNLATDEHEYVRLWVGKYLYAPPQILKLMENDSSNEVLKWVFLSRYTPKETMKLIAKRFNTNQNELMEKFSRDPDKQVREAVTENHYTSDKILFSLMHDKDNTVSDWAYLSLEARGYEFDFSKTPPLVVKKPQKVKF